MVMDERRDYVTVKIPRELADLIDQAIKLR